MPGNHLGIECEGVFINGHGNGINILCRWLSESCVECRHGLILVI